jgi:hypothetical protein
VCLSNHLVEASDTYGCGKIDELICQSRDGTVRAALTSTVLYNTSRLLMELKIARVLVHLAAALLI